MYKTLRQLVELGTSGYGGPGIVLDPTEKLLTIELKPLLHRVLDPAPVGPLVAALFAADLEYLRTVNPLLARLLGRQCAGTATHDARERGLLAEALQAFGDDPAHLRRFAAAARRHLGPWLPRRAQNGAAPLSLVVSIAKTRQARPKGGSRAFTVSGAPKDLGATDAAMEARWLASCSSWRAGARPVDDLLVVHIPAYLLVTRLLDRPFLGSTQITLPVLNAPKEEWYRAGELWEAYMRAAHPEWISGADPYAAAAAGGWTIPRGAPALALRRPRVLTSCRTSAAAPSSPPRPSEPVHVPNVTVIYDGKPLLIARRRLPLAPDWQYYCELPFAPPPSEAPRTYKHLTVGGKRLWAFPEIARLSDAGVYGAVPYVAFLQTLIADFKGGHFESVRAKAAHDRAVQAVNAGERRHLGPLKEWERSQIHEALRAREPGPWDDATWAQLAAATPGRTRRALNKFLRTLLHEQVFTVGWAQFRNSGYWPGGDRARELHVAWRLRQK